MHVCSQRSCKLASLRRQGERPRSINRHASPNRSSLSYGRMLFTLMRFPSSWRMQKPSSEKRFQSKARHSLQQSQNISGDTNDLRPGDSTNGGALHRKTVSYWSTNMTASLMILHPSGSFQGKNSGVALFRQVDSFSTAFPILIPIRLRRLPICLQ